MLSRKSIADAPKALNANDKAMWLLGWNEAVDALATPQADSAQPVADRSAEAARVEIDLLMTDPDSDLSDGAKRSLARLKLLVAAMGTPQQAEQGSKP